MEYIRPCKGQERRRRDKSSSSSSSCLTHELVMEILSRLPVKSLQKFRCVCKSWNSTITGDGYLVTQHLRNRTHHPNNSDGIVSMYRKHEHSSPILKYSVGDDYSGPVSFVITPLEKEPDHCYTITNSCDGLVGVLDLRHFYIVNPSIRKVAALPTEGSGLKGDNYLTQAGIGFDVSTGEYKAVRLFPYLSDRICSWGRQVHTGCEVDTLRPGNSCWKLVGDAPYAPYDERIMHECVNHLPVAFDGAVYWTVIHLTPEGNEPDVALAFNLSDEKFDVVMHPEGSSRPELSRVVALAGWLCVADTRYSPLRMNIWALEDYERRKWVKQYSLILGQMPHSMVVGKCEDSSPVTIRSDGIMVLYNRRGRRDYYDPQTGNFIMYELSFRDQPAGFEHIVTYTDSLVWPWRDDCKAV